MADVITKFDIIRYKNDTYPEIGSLEENNNYIDLSDGWYVHMYYDEIQLDNSIKNILLKAIIANPQQGKYSFYPKQQYCFDITDKDNIINYHPFRVPGTFEYSIVRKKDSYERVDDGEYVYEDGIYRLYDSNVDSDTVQKYTKFTETVTHGIGKLIISDRVGE